MAHTNTIDELHSDRYFNKTTKEEYSEKKYELSEKCQDIKWNISEINSRIDQLRQIGMMAVSKISNKYTSEYSDAHKLK